MAIKELLSLVGGSHLADFVDSAGYRHAMKAYALFSFVVVHAHHWLVTRVRQFPDECLPCCAGTNNQHACPIASMFVFAAVEKQARQHPNAAKSGRCKHGFQEVDG
jgi:hypothetical protein